MTARIASAGVRRRRQVDLRAHPDALAGALGLDADAVRLAERIAAQPAPLVDVWPARGRAASPTADWRDPRRYTDVPRRWLDLVAERPVAPWLQRLLLRDLLAYLAVDAQMYAPTAGIDANGFLAALPRLAAAIDDDLIVAAPASAEHRLALLLGAQGRVGHGTVRTRRDRGLLRAAYLFAGDDPLPLPHAVHTKIRDLDFFGATLLRERIAWLPADSAPTLPDPLVLPPYRPETRAQRYRRIAAENSGIARGLARDVRIRRRARDDERYRDAWLLMDRDTSAGDNAEHLYRHLLRHEPGVNAWFVLDPSSRDWGRLEREGFRLLAHGSDDHFVALLHCAHLLSSQVDSYVVKPFRKHLLPAPGWRFTFLQHGVTVNDLSRWLNEKPIDLLVTCTPDEQASFVADGTSYVFTDLEVRMTGFARHDALLRLDATEARDRLLVMPSWRRELVGPQCAGNHRELLPGFWESDFATAWRGLLGSPRLAALCADAGWRLTFVLHPNLDGYTATSPLPPHVEVLRFGELDVQRTIAQAAVLVTDYSSLASEAAFLERPAVYFQFDREEFFGGAHLFRARGGYEQQGFGPVATATEDVLAALEGIHGRGGAEEVYAQRVRAAFPWRDGRSCERIVTAVRDMDTAVRDIDTAVREIGT